MERQHLKGDKAGQSEVGLHVLAVVQNKMFFFLL